MSTSDMRVTEALNDCLELIESGSTLEECLERYPEISDELAPLLSMALETQETAGSVHPSPEAQRAGLGAITEAWAAMEERRRRRERGPWRLLRRSWVLAVVGLLVLLFGGWTTATVAQDSVPGDTLYPVKQTQERVLLLVVVTRSGKADLHARLAETRTEEATKLAAQGSDPAEVDRATRLMQEHMMEAVSLMGGEMTGVTTHTEGVVTIVGPGGRHYTLSRETSVRGDISIGGRAFNFSDKGNVGEVSIGGRPFWTDPETGQRRPFRNAGSERRSEMQDRCFSQFRQLRQIRGDLPSDFHPSHRARVEAALQRSEWFLLQTLLMMQALEDAHHPPE
ncbi:MAG: DUF5667 domain-containing protein [Chloroflexota bacterium]|nr:DUF5667 domain-containing protein [Chloroflexota bacterium]